MRKPTTTHPPTVAAELFGSEDHHYMEEAKKLFPTFEQQTALFLEERGFAHKPGETWRLRISGRKCTSSHHHQGTVKLIKVVERQVELNLQPGDRDTLRICRLIPPPTYSVDTVFSQLRDTIPAPQTEEVRKLGEQIGLDLEGIINKTHDGSHTSAIVHTMKTKALGNRWSNPETLDRFCVEVSAVREGDYITDERLDRATDRVNGSVVHGQPELVRAMTRAVLVQDGYLNRNGKGFHLTEKLLDAISVSERKRGLNRPAELDSYLDTLLGIERNHRERQERLAQITSEEERLTAEEKELMQRLHDIDQRKADLAIEREQLVGLTEDPIAQTGLQRLLELRRDLAVQA